MQVAAAERVTRTGVGTLVDLDGFGETGLDASPSRCRK